MGFFLRGAGAVAERRSASGLVAACLLFSLPPSFLPAPPRSSLLNYQSSPLSPSPKQSVQ
jgi:hypothetical protein